MKIILFIDILLILIFIINGEFIKSFYQDGITESLQNSINECNIITFLLFNDSNSNNSIIIDNNQYYPIFNIGQYNMYRVNVNIPINNDNKASQVSINTTINGQTNNIGLSQSFQCSPINDSNFTIQQNITNIRYDLFSNSVIFNLNILNSNTLINYFNYINIVQDDNNSNKMVNNSDVSNNSIPLINNNIINSTTNNTNTLNNYTNNINKNISNNNNNNNNILNDIQSSLPISANTTTKFKPSIKNKLLVLKLQNIDRINSVSISSSFNIPGLFISQKIKLIPIFNDKFSFQLSLNLNCWNLNNLSEPINLIIQNQLNQSSSLKINYPLDQPLTGIWNLSPPPPPTTTLYTFDNSPVDFLILLNINKTQNPPLFLQSDNINNNNNFKMLPISMNNGNFTIILKHRLFSSLNFNLSSPILSVKDIPYSINVKNTVISNFNFQLQSNNYNNNSYFKNNNLIIQSFNGSINSPSTILMSINYNNNNYNNIFKIFNYNFPFGYYQGNNKSKFQFKVDHLFIDQLNLIDLNFYSGYLDKQTIEINKQQNTNIDTIPPQILNIFINTTSSSQSLTVTVDASDNIGGSGIYEISIANQLFLHFEEIISGDIHNGVFQGTKDFNSLLFDSQNPNQVNQFITISDFAGNQRSFKYNDIYNIDFGSIPPLFPDIQLNTIESFQFIPNIIDTSNGAVDVTLQIKSVYIDQTWIPKFSLIYPTIGINYTNENLIFNGNYDSNSGNFIIKFTVPINSLPGTQDYIFQYPSWNSNYISSRFGSNAILTIKNSNIYQLTSYLGPTITSINISSNSYILTNEMLSKNPQTISFGIKLNLNGKSFKNGVINITSNIDPIPYSFKITQSDAIYSSGTTYKFNILISKCLTQVFEITGIELLDENNWLTFYQKYPIDLNEILNPINYKEIMPPFENTTIVTSNNISIICQDDNNDNIAPKLVEFDFNPKSINSKDTIEFYFSVMDNLEINQRSNPTIYLIGENQPPIKVDSTIISIINSSFINYKASATINYGYATRGLIVSIYGLMDTSINFRGYTTTDLLDNSFPGLINVSILSNKTNFPTINSYSLDSDNIELIIRGTNLRSNYLFGYFSSLDGSSNFQLKPIQILSNQLLFKLPNDLNTKSISLLIEINEPNNFIQNKLIINLNNFKVDTKPCGYKGNGNQCGNNGVCTDLGCICNNNYYGPDCNSKLISNYQLELGETWPSTIFIVNTKDQKEAINLINASNLTTSIPLSSNLSSNIIEAEISFLKIQEIDIYYKVVSEYEFQNKWKVTKNFNKFNNLNATSTLYSNSFSNSNTPIELTISRFPNNKVSFEFAGQTIQLNPNTVKYTIDIGSYQFKSPLNSLQILFTSSIGSTSSSPLNTNDDGDTTTCPSKSIGYTNKQESNLSWLSLKVNNVSIMGQFLQNAIIDNKTFPLSQNVLNNSIKKNDNSIGLTISILIPNYKKSAQIDPNYDLLFGGGPYGDLVNNDQKCENSSNNGFLSKNNLIIFVTLISFGVSLIIAIVILCLKYKWWIKYKTVTLYDKILNKSFSE